MVSLCILMRQEKLCVWDKVVSLAYEISSVSPYVIKDLWVISKVEAITVEIALILTQKLSHPFKNKLRNYREKWDRILSKCLYCNLCNFLVLHRIERMMPYSLSSPRLWIAEGLLNKNAWVWDFIVSQTDMIWVAVENLFVLYSSV